MEVTERDRLYLKYEEVVNMLINGATNNDIHRLHKISDKTLSKLRKLFNLRTKCIQ